MTAEETAATVVTVDLGAVRANYRWLRAEAEGAETAATVKADAYGLGAARVAPVLAADGCRTFFVAHIGEGVALRTALRDAGHDAAIHVLSPLIAGNEGELLARRLVPVLNTPDDVARWRAQARHAGRPLAAHLHVDTGMRRLGLAPGEAERLAADPAALEGIAVDLLLSHLACADEPGHPLNAAQAAAFEAWCRRLPHRRRSVANSSGVFLGARFRGDLVRPGAALYGINPRPGAANPMAPTVRFQARILQVRDVDAPETVGYGASHQITRRGRLATLAAGYADGIPRALGNRGLGHIGEHAFPIVGRVSMDLITVDVTDAPAGLAEPGRLVDLIGPENPVDRVAEAAGTIGYAVLTGLGTRPHRRHVEP